MSKKDKLAVGSPRRLCVSYSFLNGAHYCGEPGPVISGLLAHRNGSRIRPNKKKLHGVIAPISTLSDYLDIIVDDVDSLRGS